MKTIWICLIMITVTLHLNAQILGGMMNNAKRKLERTIEDKIVQQVSEELTERAFKPIGQTIDSMMRQRYQDSTNQDTIYDSEKAKANFTAFLGSMNDVADLPESYTFDVTQEVEVIDYSKKRNYIKLHYSKNEAIIGMENTDEGQTKQLVVLDLAKDLMVLYTTDKKGKKTGQAIPSVIKMAGNVMNSTHPAKDSTAYKTNFTKTGKTKKIAGYTASELTGANEREKITMFATNQFPVRWDQKFSNYTGQFAPYSFIENVSVSSEGFMLEYENIRKDEKGEKTTWITKKVSEKSFDIVNKDYTFAKAEH